MTDLLVNLIPIINNPEISLDDKKAELRGYVEVSGRFIIGVICLTANRRTWKNSNIKHLTKPGSSCVSVKVS